LTCTRYCGLITETSFNNTNYWNIRRLLFVEICKGFEDWFACLKCPDICTKACPIEKENAVEEFRQRMSLLERHNSQRENKEIL